MAPLEVAKAKPNRNPPNLAPPDPVHHHLQQGLWTYPANPRTSQGHL